MPINQATLRSLADRAGDETGECYPSAGRWIKRFVQLVEEHLSKSEPSANVTDEVQNALSFYAKRENWQRDVVMNGPRRSSWKQAPAILDKGSSARMALMNQGAE